MQKIAQIITKIIDFVYSPFQNYIPRELFRYAACGSGNMVLDWILYFITYNFIIGHNLVYFQLSTFHTFRSCPWAKNFQLCLTPHIASLCIVFPTLHGARQLSRYIMIVALNLAINYFGLKLLVEHFLWYPTPSKICITLFTVVISFLGQKYFTFRK